MNPASPANPRSIKSAVDGSGVGCVGRSEGSYHFLRPVQERCLCLFLEERKWYFLLKLDDWISDSTLCLDLEK